MFANYFKAQPIIIPVTLKSGILVAIDNGFRGKNSQTAAYGAAGGYLIGGMVFGLLAILAYQWMAGLRPAQAAQYYLRLADRTLQHPGVRLALLPQGSPLDILDCDSSPVGSAIRLVPAQTAGKINRQGFGSPQASLPAETSKDQTTRFFKFTRFI